MGFEISCSFASVWLSVGFLLTARCRTLCYSSNTTSVCSLQCFLSWCFSCKICHGHDIFSQKQNKTKLTKTPGFGISFLNHCHSDQGITKSHCSFVSLFVCNSFLSTAFFGGGGIIACLLLFFAFTSQPKFPLSSLPPISTTTSCLSLPHIYSSVPPSLFLFRWRWPFHVYQPAKVYQVAL